MAPNREISAERKAAREQEMAKVMEIIKKQGYVPAEAITETCKWYYDELKLNEYYFQTTSVERVAEHISAVYASKILYATTGRLALNLDLSEKDYAIRAAATQPGAENKPCMTLETEIENEYLTKNFCLSSYVSGSKFLGEKDIHMRLYIMTRAKCAVPEADEKETDLKKVADARFLARASENTMKLYSEIMTEAVGKLAPVIRLFEFEDSPEKRIIVAWRQGTTPNFFANISRLFASHGVYSTRKYCESFSNGMQMASFYLAPVAGGKPLCAACVQDLLDDISHTFVLPPTAMNKLAELYSSDKVTRDEASFAAAMWKFAHQFLNRYDEDYHQLAGMLEHVPGKAPKVLLSNLKRRLRHDTFNEAAVLAALMENVDLVKACYAAFEKRLSPAGPKLAGEDWEKEVAQVEKKAKSVSSEFEGQVFEAVIRFLRNVLKTNFYLNEKVAMSFRLDGAFLSLQNFPSKPYGVFFVVGAEFRGFHVRFTDIARGGIRLIRSANRQAYTRNVSTVFDENYNLAYTQQKKNKDIPEGGSKGTVLLNYENQKSGDVAFKKYVAALMDVLLPECIQVDHTGRTLPEILFLGPDEGTAELMLWARNYSKVRGYSYWKAVTTGKPPSVGGIPHDTYGMTTRSVHQFVLGVLRMLDVPEESVTKFQTGGPDGDLGSNEILISKDTTTSMVDGSGVVHDPKGLDRTELERLATERVMVCNFNKAKLSKEGFFVSTEDRNITLPDGTHVENGMQFRNTFHLNEYSAADLFVPCGGRPESINPSNLTQVLDQEGKSRFKYIIEGANLFLTQPARLELEALGVVLFKDASANKGGVTSSSREVLAALALTDEQFEKDMCKQADGSLPAFYQAYVKDVIALIEGNARAEFDCLWREHKRTGVPMCILTDKVSDKINAVGAGITSSTLWENKKLRDVVFNEVLPPTLLKHIGLEGFYKNVPENYQLAIFSASLAAKYIYQYGFDASEFALFDFVREYEAKC